MGNEPSRHVLSVSELSAYIKSKLEGDFLLRGLILKGEVSNFKTYPSGHSYFTLKDKDAMIAAVLWASAGSSLTFQPKDGDEVLVYGRISVYPPRGNYQLSVDRMELFGSGEELLRLQRLKEKLAKEGLFDESRKRPLPRFPKKVAVIAGKGSAGLRDVVFNMLNRYPLVELLEFPSLVQGKDAPQDLIDNLEKAQAAGPDIVILARGGGSSEDLAAFNDEELVRAIARCACPTISAVGHEVDVTLTDLVADKRVSTPTAAALLAVPDKNDIYQSLDDCAMRLQNALEGRLSRLKTQLGYLSQRSFFQRPESLYEKKLEELQATKRRLDLAIGHQLSNKAQLLQRESERLRALSPYGVLSRGYSISYDATGKPLQSVDQTRVGEIIKTRLKDGIIESEVTASKKGESHE